MLDFPIRNVALSGFYAELARVIFIGSELDNSYVWFNRN